ncbi:hypothetical protein D3C78_1721950 [compost metagenome]
MESNGVMPTPAPISTTGRVESLFNVKLPRGGRTSSMSPTRTVSWRWREALPWALTLMRMCPSEGALETL